MENIFPESHFEPVFFIKINKLFFARKMESNNYKFNKFFIIVGLIYFSSHIYSIIS